MRYHRNHEDGSVLFIILVAVVLIGALSAAVINSSDSDGAQIDDESLNIQVSEVQRYGSELERAVTYVLRNGHSEADIRFAHPDAPTGYGDLSADGDRSDQVFHRDGGGAAYRTPPERVNDGSGWEFYGVSALPSVGSDRADLIAVLPNVRKQFCDEINTLNQQTLDPADTAACLSAGTADIFNDTTQFSSSPNTLDGATFTQDPNTSAPRTALQACVVCDSGEYHFYHVLMVR